MTTETGVDRQIDGEGIVHVVFDRPGDKPNVLTPEILRWLDATIDELRDREGVRAVLFRSAKPGVFIAGMDVDEIASLHDSIRAAEGARMGQRVFQKIADLAVPSVAAIGGTCLGGGTELALACTTRIAADDPAVRIGLPETQIGIIPGFGGTQRLPRLVGLATALDLILTGRRLDAKRARRVGLVDRVCPAAYLERESKRLALESASGGPPARPRRSLAMRAIEGIGPLRRLAIDKARKKTAARVRPEDYPAPFRALEAVDAAFTEDLPRGLDVEARIVGELVPTATSKNLIWLFKSQTAVKKDAGVAAAPRKIRRAAVLGAGIMGGGIAQLVADRSIPVRIKDIRQEALLAGLAAAHEVWEEKRRRRRMSRREVEQRMRFLSTTLDDTGFAHVDLVLEAVVEDLGVKQKVLAAAEERIPERTVFASNTSSLPISEIAARARRPERVVGLHFFNPVHRMPLVEVIAGRRSAPEAVATVHAFAKELGKTPVVVRDSPGFLVNRILMFYLNEAMQLLSEGVRIEPADSAMKSFGMPMGPFTLLDRIGLDTARHAGEVMHAAFGGRIGPPAPVLEAMAADGRLGVKSGKGFYLYKDGSRRGPDPEAYRAAGGAEPREIPAETLQERMVLAMVNEAAVCLEDGVVREPREIDVAMVLGTGFPPFRGGLLRYADAIGVPVLVDRLSRLSDSLGERFRPAGILREMVRGERRFYPEG